MSNNFFQFKQFVIHQDRCAMKVTTDACLFGAWAAERIGSRESKVRSKMQVAGRVLDIGTGTGLLALMLAQKTNALIDTIEIEKGAFEQAKENINSSPWKDKINVYHADATEFIFPYQYDIIISNPPFYENELKSPDETKNIAHHGGLNLQQLLKIIKKNLSTEGQFFLLLPHKRNEETEKLIHSNKLCIIEKKLVRQSAKHDHFRIMITGSHKLAEEKMKVTEMTIWNEQQQYTKEFIELLKDYYLYL